MNYTQNSKDGHFEFWVDDDIRYQAKIRHVREQIVTKSFNSSQSLLEEIEFPSFFGCARVVLLWTKILAVL